MARSSLSQQAAANPLPQPSKFYALWGRRLLALLLVPALALSTYAVYTIQHANFRALVNGEAYRSGQMDAKELARTVDHYGIKSILNLRGENPASAWYRAEIETAAKLNVAHHDRSLSSGQELAVEQMDELVALLGRMPKPVLIHCQGGADRSGLVSALFEVTIAGRTPEEAERELSVWYGHVPLIRPKVLAMDRSFRRYVSKRVSVARSRSQTNSATR